MPAKWTAKFKSLVEAVLFRGEEGAADSTQKLSFRAIVAVQIISRGVAAGASCIRWYCAFTAPPDRLQFLTTVSTLVFTTQMLPVFFLKRDYFREFVRFEFLIFGRMYIIKRPLLQRYIFTDKTNQPAVLAIKVVDNRK